MADSLTQFVQQAINMNNWNEAVSRLENAVLQCVRIEPELLERIPAEQFDASPLLQKAKCEELIRRGDLVTAKEALSIVIKKIALHTLKKPFLSALSMLGVVNLRMGFTHEAESIIRFLRDEWDSSDEEIRGDVAYAIARGMFLLEDEADESDDYYRHAINAFDRDGETERGSLTLFELTVRGYLELSPSDWEERMTEFAQRVKRRQISQAFQHFLLALRALSEGNPKQAEQELKGCGELPLPHPFQAMPFMLQLTIAIRMRNIENVTQTLAFMDSLHPELEVDLEWQFAWVGVQFEWAFARLEWTEMQKFSSQSRAIFKQGLSPRFGVWMGRMKSILEGRRTVDQDHVSSEGTLGLWRVSLFGVLKFRLEGRTVQSIHWKRKKTKELALYLLLRQGYSAPKELIAEALYPNHQPDKMANQLYVAAHQLKGVIRDYFGVDGGVVIKDGVIRLKDGFISEVDVEQYQALVAVADQLWLQERELADQMYEKAALLYDGIALDVLYVDWLDQCRERLLMKQCILLQRRGLYAVDQNRYDQAELFYRQWIDLTPLNEEAYQELLRVLCNQGKQPEAEFLYRQLEHRLQMELAILPLSETQSIIRS